MVVKYSIFPQPAPFERLPNHINAFNKAYSCCWHLMCSIGLCMSGKYRLWTCEGSRIGDGACEVPTEATLIHQDENAHAVRNGLKSFITKDSTKEEIRVPTLATLVFICSNKNTGNFLDQLQASGLGRRSGKKMSLLCFLLDSTKNDTKLQSPGDYGTQQPGSVCPHFQPHTQD